MTDNKDDLTEFKIKLPTVNNEKLCEVIVASKYLGIMKEQAVLCMEELSRRRDAGDVFEFEKHIDSTLNSLPKFKMNMKEILVPSMSKILDIFK